MSSSQCSEYHDRVLSKDPCLGLQMEVGEAFLDEGMRVQTFRKKKE